MNIIPYGVMSYQPVILGLKLNIRIVDLTARDVMIVTCPACHWTANVAPHVLHALYHEMRKLIDIEANMKCKRCGARGALFWCIQRKVEPKFS